jgi:hypothetical protein
VNHSPDSPALGGTRPNRSIAVSSSASSAISEIQKLFS